SVVKGISEKASELRRLDSRVIDRDAVRLFADGNYVLRDEDRRTLRGVDWAKFGNLRALRRVTEQVLLGRPAQEAIEALQPVAPIDHARRGSAAEFLEEVMAGPSVEGGLVAQVREAEFARRLALQELLRRDDFAVARLAEKTGIPDRQLREQAHQLSRRR